MMSFSLVPICKSDPDSKVHGANMGPTWVLSAPDGPHVGPMNLVMTGWLAVANFYWDYGMDK